MTSQFDKLKSPEVTPFHKWQIDISNMYSVRQINDMEQRLRSDESLVDSDKAALLEYFSEIAAFVGKIDECKNLDTFKNILNDIIKSKVVILGSTGKEVNLGSYVFLFNYVESAQVRIPQDKLPDDSLFLLIQAHTFTNSLGIREKLFELQEKAKNK